MDHNELNENLVVGLGMTLRSDGLSIPPTLRQGDPIAINEGTCQECGRTFRGARGMSVHRRMMHREIVDLQTMSSLPRAIPSSRWTAEQEHVLRLEYSKLSCSSTIVARCRALLHLFPGRTVDALRKRLSRDSPSASQASPPTILASVPEVGDSEGETGESEVNGTAVTSCLSDEIDVLLRTNRLRNKFAGETLRNAGLAAISSRKEESIALLEDWLSKVTSGMVGQNKKRCNKLPTSLTGKRRQQYRQVQTVWQHGPKKAVDLILKRNVDMNQAPDSDTMFDFWTKIFSQSEPSESGIVGGQAVRSSFRSLLAPIGEKEIKETMPKRATAAGPDGITPTMWRMIPNTFKRIFFNIMLCNGDVSSRLVEARTIFLAKSDHPGGAADFRPISITSVVLRHLNGILSRRLMNALSHHEGQAAFQRIDGIAANVLKLQAILGDSSSNLKSLYIVSLDLQKAFDSVGHGVVVDVLKKRGLPSEFVDYIKHIYGKAHTNLTFMRESKSVRIGKGVLQGDPLSPVIFNCIMDEALQVIDPVVGYPLGDSRVSCLAYADDVILLGESKEGLQMQVNNLVNAFKGLGLVPNPSKCFSLSLVKLGREKKVLMDATLSFMVDGTVVRPTGPNDVWKYLGIDFKGCHSYMTQFDALRQDVELLDRAPIKPYQRMLALNRFVYPKYLHGLALQYISSHTLGLIDKYIRKISRKWLKLPNDCPNAFLHASVKSGGLGIPCVSTSIPLMSDRRFANVMLTLDDRLSSAIAQTKFHMDISKRRNESLPAKQNIQEPSSNLYWANHLCHFVDTNDLPLGELNGAVSRWIQYPPRWLPQYRWIKFLQIRSGCLPSRARVGGRQDVNDACRACLSVGGGGSQRATPRETNYHILQKCKFNRLGRLARHNALIGRLHEGFRKRGLTIWKEHHFQTLVGVRNPDLVVCHGSKAYILDVHVVNGGCIKEAYTNKRAKYGKLADLKRQISEMSGATRVLSRPITFTYKGLLHESSVRTLKELGLPSSDLPVLALTALEGTLRMFYAFMAKFHFHR